LIFSKFHNTTSLDALSIPHAGLISQADRDNPPELVSKILEFRD
jgi:hypothetical protein